MEKYMIWTSEPDFEDWRQDLEEEYPELTEAERVELMYEINSGYLDDERVNLDIPMDNEIVAIGDIGRWNGTFHGYKRVGNNIRDCLSSTCDYAEFFLNEDGDLCCVETHHDGSNRILFRAYRKNISETQKDRFEQMIYERAETEEDVRKYTRSLGREIAKVYGWKSKVS